MNWFRRWINKIINWCKKWGRYNKIMRGEFKTTIIGSKNMINNYNGYEKI